MLFHVYWKCDIAYRCVKSFQIILWSHQFIVMHTCKSAHVPALASTCDQLPSALRHQSLFGRVRQKHTGAYHVPPYLVRHSKKRVPIMQQSWVNAIPGRGKLTFKEGKQRGVFQQNVFKYYMVMYLSEYFSPLVASLVMLRYYDIWKYSIWAIDVLIWRLVRLYESILCVI